MSLGEFLHYLAVQTNTQAGQMKGMLTQLRNKNYYIVYMDFKNADST